VQRLLGKGTSKDVFGARDIRLDRDVALGMVKTVGGVASLTPRALQEIRTTANLDQHPNIVKVYDVIEEDGATWIVSQLVPGGSVADRVKAHPGGLPIPDAIRIARQVADALHFAHEHGVIHRDVKPANVLVASNDTFLLADFGAALRRDLPRLTASGAPVGTPAYMSPEQVRGETVDRRSDLYALGAMLFELVCGQTPFKAESVVAVLWKQVNDPVPRAADVKRAVPEPLSRLIAHLMSKRPDDRPASGRIVSQALEGLESVAPARESATAVVRRMLPAPLDIGPQRRFVGRGDALAELDAAWRRAVSGLPQLAVITGEPGIGKTSLAAAFARIVHARGAWVLFGRCDEDALVSYQPFVEAVRQLIADDPDLVTELEAGLVSELSELARLIPELRRRPLLTAADQTRESIDRYQLFEGVLALLSPVIRRHRMLLVIDDMQWADEPTGLLLRHVMRARLTGLLVIVTRRAARPLGRDPLVKVTEDITRRSGGNRRTVLLRLTGLNPEETHEMASTRREQPVDPKFSRLLQADTEGHPFFIEQVLRGLRDADLGAEDRAMTALKSLGVPVEVQAFIDYRLFVFSADIQELLTQAAVCGPEFGLTVLSELRGEDPPDVIRLLSEPLAAGVIREPSIGRYAFSHALFRETLYDRRLGLNERATLHLRVGEALERLPPEDTNAAELALHFHAARKIGGAERAVKYSRAAASHAANALAYEEAAAHARNACEALSSLGPGRDGERCRMLRLAGRLYWQAGDQRAAQEEFRQAAKLARRLGDPVQFARAALGYAGRSYNAEAVDSDLRRLLEESLATLPEAATALRAQLLARLAEALSPVEADRAIELTTEALEILRRDPNDDALVTVVAARHTALLHIDYHEERSEIGQQWVRITERRSDRFGLALHWRLFDLLERGDPSDIAEARVIRDRLAALADELKQPLFRHFVAAFDAKWLLMTGQFEDAERHARDAYTHGRRAQGTHVELLFGGQRLLLLRDQGRLADLAIEMSEVMDPGRLTLPAWRVATTMVCCDSGDFDRARAELAELGRDEFAAIPRDMFWLSSMCMLADVTAELDDTALMTDLRRQLEPHAAYNAQIGLAAVIGPVHGFVGRLAAVLGDQAAAEGHFDRALERCAILGARPAEARIQFHYGESLLGRDGRHARAVDLLSQSRSTARKLAMASLAESACQALARLEHSPEPGVGAPP
jgi:hypothetical protein